MEIQKIAMELEELITKYGNEYAVHTDVSHFLSEAGFRQKYIRNGMYDIIFLDIDATNDDGCSIGQYIRKQRQDEMTQLVFVSQKENYSWHLFEFRAMALLQKPLNFKKVKNVLDQYQHIFGKSMERFRFRIKNEIYQIPFSDILYFESIGRKIRLYCMDESVHEFTGTLKKIYEQIPLKNFLMIHNAFVVNANYIVLFKTNLVVMKNNTELPVSKHRRKEVMRWKL